MPTEVVKASESEMTAHGSHGRERKPYIPFPFPRQARGEMSSDIFAKGCPWPRHADADLRGSRRRRWLSNP